MNSCPICGSTNIAEWRHCPDNNNQLICGTEHCSSCRYWRNEEDRGTFWCTYWHGRRDDAVPSRSRSAKEKIAEMEKQSNDLFRQGKWRVAEEIIWEIARLERENRGSKGA